MRTFSNKCRDSMRYFKIYSNGFTLGNVRFPFVCIYSAKSVKILVSMSRLYPTGIHSVPNEIFLHLWNIPLDCISGFRNKKKNEPWSGYAFNIKFSYCSDILILFQWKFLHCVFLSNVINFFESRSGIQFRIEKNRKPRRATSSFNCK